MISTSNLKISATVSFESEVFSIRLATNLHMSPGSMRIEELLVRTSFLLKSLLNIYLDKNIEAEIGTIHFVWSELCFTLLVVFTECLFSADTDEEIPDNYDIEEYHKVRPKMSKCL